MKVTRSSKYSVTPLKRKIRERGGQMVLVEADLGFSCQGVIEGIGVQGKAS